MTQPVDIEALRALMERLRAANPSDDGPITIEDEAADAIEAMATELEALRAERGRMVEETVKQSLTVEELEKPVPFVLVKWEGRLHCAYLNNFRIVGGKPWGGGTVEKEWKTSLREVIRAFPALQKAVGLNNLGQPMQAYAALQHKEPKP